jgi:ABC-type transport system substrate-binding protein
MSIRYVAIVFLFCALFTVASVQNTSAEPSELKFDDTFSGPYVDKVLYKVLGSESSQVQALLDNQIDVLGGPFGNEYYMTLDIAEDIEVSSILRNGYGQITINCRDAPLNWTALRRAFAFAYDKTEVQSDIFQGYSQLQDSLVPIVNSEFSIEDELPYHYYNPELAFGNQLLNDSGFVFDPVSGYRNDPNGNPIHIVISYSPYSPAIAGGCAQIGVDALTALGISAETNPEDFNTLLGNMYNHEAYDMIVRVTDFPNNDVDWLAYEYWSNNTDEYGMNPSNFINTTYDSFRDSLINGTTYQEVYSAASAMQEILHYNVPVLVVYEDLKHAAYRTDRFDGHVVDENKNIANEWTNMKAHLSLLEGGPFSGTFRVIMGQEPSTFNPMTTTSPYSKMIFSNIFNSLLRTGPDGEKRLDLAESYLMETHVTNPAVPEGHTRFTFDIIQNASWSDGTPLTADDIVYTFTYYYESYWYGNPMGKNLLDLFAAFSPHPSTAVLEFDSESYWLLSKITDVIILQKTLLQSIGFSGWNTWNPIFSSDPYPTSGPFNVTYYSPGVYCELSYHPAYHYRVRGIGSDTPVLTGPDDFEVVQGTSGHSISWNCIDDNPLVYRIFINDEILEADYYESQIELDIDTHLTSFGMYNFTLEIKDWEYQEAVDTVIVDYVPDTFAPEITGPDDFLILDAHTLGIDITWMVFDHNIANCTFFRNGEYVGGVTWAIEPEPIIRPIPYFLGSMTEGIYNFTILVQDEFGNNSTDTVFVTVVSDNTPPILVGPDDIAMYYGDQDVQIQWNATDDYPETFEIYIDDTLSDFGTWESGVPITFNLDWFQVGVHNFTIYVTDLGGFTVLDTVMVTIIEPGEPGELPTEMLLIGLGAVAVIVVVIGIVVKIRR